MAMDYEVLARAMLKAWNSVPITSQAQDHLGDKLYDAVISVRMDQESDPDGKLGRARFRQIAKVLLRDFLQTNSGLEEQRFRYLADVLINHIQTYAEIKSLPVTNTPDGTPLHAHAPALTVQTQGRIL